MQVTKLVAPGPLVATQTPTRPVLCIPLRREAAALLVPRQNGAQFVLEPGQRLVNRHAGPAGVGEYYLDAVVDQALHQNVRPVWGTAFFSGMVVLKKARGQATRCQPVRWNQAASHFLTDQLTPQHNQHTMAAQGLRPLPVRRQGSSGLLDKTYTVPRFMFDKVKKLFSSGAGDERLRHKLDEIRNKTPIPVFWLYGKTQSGKTSVIKFLTGADDAEIGHGFKPCTRFSRQYMFPTPEAHLLTFLDTRGVDEPGYDPREDLARFDQQAHVVIITVKVMDHALENLLTHFRPIHGARLSRPVVLVLTCLHEAYPQQQHPEPYPFTTPDLDQAARQLPQELCVSGRATPPLLGTGRLYRSDRPHPRNRRLPRTELRR